MKNSSDENSDYECPHKNVKAEGGFIVCQDCGLTFDEDYNFEVLTNKQSQLDYERHVKIKEMKTRQNPILKQKFDKLKMLDRWYRDYETSFTEQKRTMELLKLHEINITTIQFLQIKKRYLTFNRKHRKSYQNMVIIFLAIIWLVIKDATTIRVEKYIKILKKLGHRINKKMLTSSMEKVKRTEIHWKKFKTLDEIEVEVKNKIKILFQRDLNNITFDRVKEFIPDQSEFEKLKVTMQLIADKFLNQISYEYLKNLNYKAFTAGFIYYCGQTLDKDKRKIFTQSLIESSTNFSSTTIRKKYKKISEILGTAQEQAIN